MNAVHANAIAERDAAWKRLTLVAIHRRRLTTPAEMEIGRQCAAPELVAKPARPSACASENPLMPVLRVCTQASQLGFAACGSGQQLVRKWITLLLLSLRVAVVNGKKAAETPNMELSPSSSSPLSCAVANDCACAVSAAADARMERGGAATADGACLTPSISVGADC